MVMMTMIMMVIPILINDDNNDYSQNYDEDSGNDSECVVQR